MKQGIERNLYKACRWGKRIDGVLDGVLGRARKYVLNEYG
jgi:hypothetical protein